MINTLTYQYGATFEGFTGYVQQANNERLSLAGWFLEVIIKETFKGLEIKRVNLAIDTEENTYTLPKFDIDFPDKKYRAEIWGTDPDGDKIPLSYFELIVNGSNLQS